MYSSSRNVETFAVDVLRRYGGRTTALRKSALRVTFEQAPPFAGERELVLAFERKALEHHPGATLLIPGSAFYRELLEHALGQGATILAFTPIVEPLPARPEEPLFSAETSLTWRAGETSNDPHAVFNFAISYQSVVTSDDLVSIVYDGVDERFREPAIGTSLHTVWSEALGRPPGGWPMRDAPDLHALLPSVLEELDARTARKVSRARRNMQRHLDQEIRAIEDYYRALIAEDREALNRVTRTAPDEAAPHQKRIQRHQLDWKRRVAEETRHHQCRVHVRLVSAAIVYMPRTELEISGRALNAPVSVRFNHFLGTLDGLVCAKTGSERAPWALDEDGAWCSGARWVDDEEGKGDDPDGDAEETPPVRSENEEVSP